MSTAFTQAFRQKPQCKKKYMKLNNENNKSIRK